MLRLRFCRPFSSSSSPKGSRIYNFLSNSRDTPAQPASPSKPSSLLRFNAVTSPNTPSSFPRYSLLALSTSVAAIASYTILSDNNHTRGPLEESVSRLFHHMRQTGVAASVLWQSLSSVLSSANHEVRSGFELRVASFLADIAAVSPPRRVALVGAGGGKVLDWLLETVAVGGERCGVQAEAARALAYLIADPNVSSDVLGRPHAVTYLLRFVFSCQPKKKKRRSSFDLSDSLKGRSMLVAAIMDIVTSNCNRVDKYYKPLLPGNADLRDILAAIEVIEEGGLHMDKLQENEDEDDDDGGDDGKGIGIKILEGTTALSFTRNNEFKNLENSNADCVETGGRTPKTVALLNKHDSSPAQDNLSSVVVPGLWDDLHCQHVAVPFAAWALANWAMSSTSNRSRIWELDQDGNAVKTALMAPERSVKWHGSLMARLLLEDQNLLLNNSISDWSSTLLTTIYHASKNDDIPLAEVALSAFLISIERCPGARKMVMEKGLHVMRDTAKLAAKHKKVQEALAKALELIYAKEKHFSLEESQKWSGILLPWLFRKTSSDSTRASSSRILSCILEEHGPAAVPISQGWLAMMLNEVVVSQKASSVRGLQPKSDKVKTQIDQSNILLASQTTNQLAAAVVNLAGNQLGLKFDSIDSSPLADLLSLEPFAGPTKNLKGENVPKLNVADSALATLKGIKVLTELCSGDLPCQEKMAELGVLCLLRRFLLCDDYEKLAAMEAYDAFRAPEAPENVSNNTGELSKNDTNNQSSIQVPSASHIRRHAARLLTILSALPKVQKVILADKTWCKWLEDCANGDILGCTDPKLQSYARATLLNVVCNCPSVKASKGNDPTALVNKSGACPRYNDMLFLINPEMPHWKLCDYLDGKKTLKDASDDADRVNDRGSAMTRVSNLWNDSTAPNESSGTDAEVPQVDVVFIHGLRGGPYKTWRISENKVSTKSGLVEKIDEEAGKSGTFWPGEWLSTDFPQARMFTIKYKTNLTQWSGASLPLQEVSSQLLEKLLAAGIGNRPVVFVTHSMGGLVVKQILHKAKAEKLDKFINNTVGVVFYSCPHFGSKLADMPWRIGFVLRPAPSVGELRSGSQRLVELNDFLRNLHKKGLIDVLSFCETKVTPIVEGYGGWAFRMEIVPLESAYPGFGELVVLESTDHVNSCKPLSRTDPSYTETLEFLRKLYSHYSERGSSQ